MGQWNIPKVILSYHWNITEIFLKDFSEHFVLSFVNYLFF